ncbi:MarR family transcriptional regulator [Saccharolobus islandicus]|uniref:MarR family transcriptional regulator n=1 Tax=Saccharolobus islandicus TaxID=43080 RepID=UPI003D7ECBEE
MNISSQNKIYTVKRNLILEYCKTPKSFTELRDLTGMSDAGLSKALNDLIKKGYLQKTSDGKYVITDKVMQSYKERIVNRIWFKYQGISDEKIEKIADLLKDEGEFYILASKGKDKTDDLTLLLKYLFLLTYEIEGSKELKVTQ